MTETSIQVERSKRLGALLERWIRFTGVDVDQKSFMVGGSGVNDYDVHSNYERIHRAMELDPSSALPALCLSTFFNQYIAESSVSVADLLDPVEGPKSMKQLEEMRAIQAELADPIFTDIIETLKSNIKAGAEHYACEAEAVGKILDGEEIEDVLFQAFEGTESMPEDWFSQGNYDQEPPKFFKSVLAFESDLQAIHFAAQVPHPFVALAIVQDDFNEIFSHFLFLCKSGQNVWMMHDRTEWEHPGQEELISGRSGGQRHWERDKEFALQFPYHLLEELKKPEGSVISRVAISELGASESTWLILVFERIRLKYFEGKYVPKKLVSIISDEPVVIQSCQTGDVKALLEAEGVKLLGDGGGSNVAVTTTELQTTTLAPITREDVKQEAVAGDFSVSTGQHEWLEDRYDHLIPDAVLNPKRLTEEASAKLIGSEGENMSRSMKKWKVRMGKPQHKFPAVLGLIDGKVDSEALECVRSDITSMESTPFGDIEKLQRTSRWHARYNKANGKNQEKS